jgi:hypothetical protein
MRELAEMIRLAQDVGIRESLSAQQVAILTV